MAKHGPILSPMQEIPGTPSNHEGDSGDCHDGIKGYPASTGGKIPELTFVDNGEFGKERAEK